MGSKKEIGKARRHWATQTAAAEQAAIVVNGFVAGATLFPQLQHSPAAQAGLRTVQKWQQHHSTIYTVDPDLQTEVVRTGVPEGPIPGEVLLRTPHQAPMFILAEPVPVPDPGTNITTLYNMFIVTRLDDRLISAATGKVLPTTQPLLRFVWFGAEENNSQQHNFTTSSLQIQKSIDLKKALAAILEDIPETAGVTAEISREIRGTNWKEVNETLFPLATMLTLYTCSQNPDLTPVRPPPQLTRTQKNIRFSTGLHNLGFRVGAAIRENNKTQTPTNKHGNTKRSVVPHMRKAHWHRFWTGPRRGNEQERKIVLRWIPPVAVNVEKGDITPTVHPIRKTNTGNHQQ